MVIFVKPDGTTIVSNDSIGVGSHVGMVEIVAPTRAGAFVELLLQLPSGLVLPPEVCTPRSEISSESIGVYTCTLSRSVTSEAGRVVYQVRFTYADGQIELTPGGSFIIQSGVVVVPPENVGDDAYEEIKSLIATLNANYTEILERFDQVEEENAELSASLGSAVKQASESAAVSINSASQAKSSETNAKASESNAKSSETAASQSAESAAKSAAAAAISETNAKTSEENAKASEKAIEEAKDILSRYPKFTTTVVDTLPSTGISINTFYLVKGSESTSDRYAEYMFVPNSEPVAGELYEDTDGHFERIGMQSAEAVSAGAPHFDLTALGLPSTPMTGVSVSVNIDTTEIREALSKGPVKFTLGIANVSSTIVVGGYLSGSLYVCTYRIDRDHYLFIHVASGSVGSAIVYSTNLPAISGEEDDGKVVTVLDGEYVLGDAVTSTDISLTVSGKPADAKVTGDRLALLEKGIADLLYKEISVTSFTNSAGTVELGATVNNVTLTWRLNKTPVSVTIDGTAQEALAYGSVNLTGLALKANKTWTLKATDERDAVATKTTAVSFVNGVYYGAAALGAMNSAFILGLTRTLRSNKLPSFTVNAAAGQYIYYCVPTRYGTCSFSVGGFTGGFSLAATTAFTNASGYTEEYYVYKSDNAGLGSTTVTVS